MTKEEAKRLEIEENRLKYGRIVSIVPNPANRPLKGRGAFLRRRREAALRAMIRANNARSITDESKEHGNEKSEKEKRAAKTASNKPYA